MALSKEQKQEIKTYLISKIRAKLAGYDPETNSMPFHFRLLGKDRMALFSFIHSVNTTLGTSIFEKVGQMIALPHAKEAKDQEVKEILSLAQKGEMGKKLKKRVDLFVIDKDGVENYFEIKSAKPNINEFTGIKKQLLDWVAMRGSIDPKVKIKTIVAIPYNPYEPQPYERWTLQGLFDLKIEVLVGAEFWDLLGGKNTYEDLLTVFEEAGKELYSEIDTKMKQVGKRLD